MVHKYKSDWMKRRAELLAQESGAESCEYVDGGAYCSHSFEFYKAGRSYTLRAPGRTALVELSEGFRVACQMFDNSEAN